MSFLELAAVLLLLGVAPLAARHSAVGALPAPSSRCQRKCGDVDIPYPFGIGPESPDHCAMRGFSLSCKDMGNNVSKPFYGNVEVLNISLQHGQARVMNYISSYCYNIKSQTMEPNEWNLDLKGTPYMLSDTDNMFTVVGCRALAYVGDEDNVGKFMSGCVAMCRRGDPTSMTNGSCSGIGCCRTAIPRGLDFYQVWFDHRFNPTNSTGVNSTCSYAVLMDSSNFTFSTSYAITPTFNTTYEGRAPLVLDWAIRKHNNCKVAQEKPDYACVSDKSECFNSTNGPGYICNCTKGFDGNPYLPNGCQDIIECEHPNEYHCNGTCLNKIGGYDCVCPAGTRGNASIEGGCQKDLPPGEWVAIPLRERVAIGTRIFRLLVNMIYM